ncbi:MAG TPA: ATP-dependent DNA helicase RecG [Burkholderiaceae bacterium]|nr:ATP-dependent DNA helicase RecG [Burkholderiaceae bacterium]
MASARPVGTAAARAGSRGLAARLAAIGLTNDWDFVLHLPLRYEDETAVVPIEDLREGVEAQVEGVVTAADVVYRGRRQLRITLQDGRGATLVLRFLHFYPSQQKQFGVGRRIRAFGAARGGLAGKEMVHPRVRVVSEGEPLPTTLTPVYPSTAGVPQAWLRKRIARALETVDRRDPLHGVLPEAFPSLASALQRLHQPPPDAEARALAERTDPAWQRLKFDELVAQQIALRRARAARERHQAPVLHADGLAVRLLASLPFRLTRAQQRVWREVERDLGREIPMQRLVQGDVGSGKTVIAALAAARAIESGWQAALMAPTELLAEQHFGRIAHWLAPLGVRTVWLAGRLGAAAKRAAQREAASGSAQLVIGTHALIQEAVDFDRLGLAIVDEQHRFGVAQRLALRGSDRATVPHIMMLSATPIPRTLAMSYLADLDVSVIDQLPPGRRPVVTKMVATRRRDEVLARIRKDVAAGRQAYWVCPLVEESAAVEAAAATATHERIVALLPELRIGLLHGQLPSDEKTAVMQRFARREVDVLVATTVIEVGVDVPNATLMVVEHAERFGLAQLHQLRGRVGRGAQQSYCVLLYEEPLSDTARERLKVIYETTDGFEVARRDLMMRGPGEFLGSRQSGVPLLRLADLERDAALVERARRAAEVLLEQDAAAAEEHVRRWYAGRSDFLAA